jgi:hypothetical protein
MRAIAIFPSYIFLFSFFAQKGRRTLAGGEITGISVLRQLSFSVFFWPSKDGVQSTGFSRQYWGSSQAG